MTLIAWSISVVCSPPPATIDTNRPPWSIYSTLQAAVLQRACTYATHKVCCPLAAPRHCLVIGRQQSGGDGLWHWCIYSVCADRKLFLYVLIDLISSEQPVLVCLTRSCLGGFACSLAEMSMKMRRRPSLILDDIGGLASIVALDAATLPWADSRCWTLCIMSFKCNGWVNYGWYWTWNVFLTTLEVIWFLDLTRFCLWTFWF